jgi:hypothetical protein
LLDHVSGCVTAQGPNADPSRFSQDICRAAGLPIRSTPGIRLKIDPIKDVSLPLAVLNGYPAGPGPGDEQLRNRYGLNFRVSDPAFIIGEAQFRRNIGKKDEGLATTLKLGGWGHLGQFEDKRFANDGTLLANPASSGVAVQHRGNSGVYAIIDQQLYRPKGGDSQSGISVFSRVSLSPSDVNLIDAYIDGGIVFAGLIPRRPTMRLTEGRMPAASRSGAALLHWGAVCLCPSFRQTSQSARSSFQSVMQALFLAIVFLTMFLTMLTKSLIAHDPSGTIGSGLHPCIGSGMDLTSEPSARRESGGCTSISALTYGLWGGGTEAFLTSKANAAPGATSSAG